MVEASLQAQDKASSSQQTQAVIRDRHLQMYRESKAKRIKKIKSKVYRALKKKQRTKEDQKRLELLADEDPELYRTEIERQEKDRAKERLSLRHRNKNKFTEQLKRYADQKDVQKIYGELNRERKKVLKKMNLEDWQELASSESDYAEAEFEAQAIKEIEKEFDSEEERVDEEESTDIVQQLMKRGRENMIKEARELVATLRGENPATADSPSAALAAEGRAKYIRKEQLLDDAKEGQGKIKGLSALDALKAHTRDGDDSSADEDASLGKRANLKPLIAAPTATTSKPAKLSMKSLDLSDAKLLEGVSIDTLKEKYKKKLKTAFKPEDIKQFMDEGEGAEYEEQLVGEIDENKDEFDKEKEEEYEKLLPEEKKPLKGWGEWTGAGIAEKPVDHAAEAAKKKAQIEALKAKRKDGKMSNVIINDNKSKELKEFMIDKLPHPFQNKAQFDYLHSAPLGKEWTGVSHHDRLIKPAVQTRSGEIIAPISKK